MTRTRGKNAEALIRKMREVRGYLYPEWEFVARRDPEFFAAYDRLYTEALASNRGLPIKYRELVALGILAFRGAREDAIANHIRRAFRHGATRAEVLGALEATIVPGGAVTFFNGIRGLARVDHVPRSSRDGAR
ncbi:MAG: carboxymuconolactone decarboxylase family protein [Candidatus Rokubacteria bacterium]|nr:carboxymuconolactone decarboxylase family protein [Candidatus Rokubacteria bacterium]